MLQKNRMKQRKPPKKEKSKQRRIVEWGVQIALLLAAVIGISVRQTRNMVASGEAAPSFVLPDLSGNPVFLSDAVGKKVVLYFFAPWCSVCHATSHNINALREAYKKDELAIYAVGLGWDTEAKLVQFAKKHGLEVPVLKGDERTAARYHISAFPSVYILDEEGRIAHRLVGYTTEWGLRLRTALTGIL